MHKPAHLARSFHTLAALASALAYLTLGRPLIRLVVFPEARQLECAQPFPDPRRDQCLLFGAKINAAVIVNGLPNQFVFRYSDSGNRAIR